MNVSVQLKSIFLCLLLAGFLAVPAAYGQLNPIQTENALTGTRDWQIVPKRAGLNRKIEGYASATSVNIGERITFHVSIDSGTRFAIEIYRMGWYNGDGGRLVYARRGILGRLQPLAEANHTTELDRI